MIELEYCLKRVEVLEIAVSQLLQLHRDHSAATANAANAVFDETGKRMAEIEAAHNAPKLVIVPKL